MKTPRRALSGVLLFDKSLGLSSNDALQQVKRLFRAEKTGHTGTLDPLASGLLPLMFGQATKFSDDLVLAPKSYWTKVRLGFSSTTGDAEGELQAASGENLPAEAFAQHSVDSLQAVAQAMQGPQLQTPPMYSALKKDGKALYEYARKGIAVEVQARPITVHECKVIAFHSQDGVCEVELEVTCSKGTYIRTLGEDFAKRLGTVGYLTGLRRTAIGDLQVSQAHSLQSLKQWAEQGKDPAELLLPVDRLLSQVPSVQLPAEMARRFGHGQRLPLEAPPHIPEGRVRVYTPAEGEAQQRFLGTGNLETNGKTALLRPDRLVQEDS